PILAQTDRLSELPALPVFVGSSDLHRGCRGSGRAVHSLLASIFCPAARRGGLCRIFDFGCDDRAPSVFHFLYHGLAGVLGPRSSHLYFHSLRVRVSRRRASFSAQHPAASCGASARVHAISLSAFLPRQYLFRSTKRR